MSKRSPRTVREFLLVRLTALADNEPSLTAFAEKCGVSRQTAMRWLSGENVPGIEAAVRICRAFDKPLEWLTGGKAAHV